MESELLEWLTRYGAPVLFFAQLLGIVGLPIPDELLLTVAGALVQRGLLNASSTYAAAVGGCLSGITVSYALGRYVGFPLLRRKLGLHARIVDRAQSWFRRYGGLLLAFGYFIPGVRHVTAIAAGSTPLDYGTFARYAYPGGILWSSVFLGLGYVAGERWPEVAQTAASHATLVALVLVSAFGGYVLFRALADRRRT